MQKGTFRLRLSKRIQEVIKESVQNSFGNVTIYLFGSRVDDSKSGGDIDIDIAIDTDISKSDFRKNKVKFVTNMVKKNYDLKIDIVNYRQADKLLFDEINSCKVKIG